MRAPVPRTRMSASKARLAVPEQRGKGLATCKAGKQQGRFNVVDAAQGRLSNLRHTNIC